MDHAVGMVQAYLRVNGYFTVTEYPVVLPVPGGGFRTATDLDILALRFPHAGRASTGAGGSGLGAALAPVDPALATDADQPDMLIGEVKEGKAELNAGARDQQVVQAVLTRFGCCDETSAPEVTRRLHRHGRATLPNGHPVRLVAFGSWAGSGSGGRYLRLTHGHLIRFLQDHLRRHWEAIRVGEVKDPALGLLVLMEKAGKGAS